MKFLSTIYNKKKNSADSFTIIELLTAMAIFIFIITSVLGIYTVSIQKHYQAQKSQLVAEELRYAMELMSQDIKNSYIMKMEEHTFGTDGEDAYLLFLAHKRKLGFLYENCISSPSEDSCLVYKINYTSTDPEDPGYVEPTETAGNGIYVRTGIIQGWTRLTSPRLEIEEDSQFFVPTLDKDFPVLGERDQPRVSILIKAKAIKDRQGVSEIVLQTTVTQRELENKYEE
jgi:type II secretory pathway pseudopilin PulG